MDIPNTIKKFRIDKNLKQTDLQIGKFSSTISRIENGTRDIKINDLKLVIDALDLSDIEFFTYAFLSDYSDNYAAKIRRASKNLNDSMMKTHLLDNYYIDEYKFSNSSKKLAEYYVLKIHFQDMWDLPPLEDDEITHVFNHLLSFNFYGYYEYLLLLNIVSFFDKEQTRAIFSKMLPIKDESFKDHDTKKYAYTSLINAITKRIYERDFEDAFYYIKIAESLDTNNTNYYFRFSIQYLKNIIKYIETKDMKFLNKIYTFIDLIKDIGDTKIASLLEEEVKDIIFKEKEFSLKDLKPILIKDQ